MSPWQRKLRRALGSVKEQTTIGLAKVVGVKTPELEVALVKATSHDRHTLDEKHVQEVISLTSSSRANAMSCVAHLSRCLARTHNWIVAVKVLMLIHRLLRDGGGDTFEEELLRESRAGGHVLNLSGFQDTSGWEFSAFVRTYALYLDELLDYNAGNRGRVTGDGTPPSGSNSNLGRSGSDGTPSSSNNSSFGRRSGGDAYGSGNEEQAFGCRSLTLKEMKPKELLERMPPLQRMLDRVLACLPAGDAETDSLIQNALGLIVKDSFLFYESVCDGLTILSDAFFKMQKPECTRAFEIQAVAAQQAEAMDIFYGFCKDRGGCQVLKYPYIRRIPEQLLETMEGFLREISMKTSMERQEGGSKELGKLSAIPAPPLTQPTSAPTQVFDVQEQLSKEKSHPMGSFAGTDASAWETLDAEIVPQVSAMALGEERQAQEHSLHTQTPHHTIPVGSASSVATPKNPSSLLA